MITMYGFDPSIYDLLYMCYLPLLSDLCLLNRQTSKTNLQQTDYKMVSLTIYIHYGISISKMRFEISSHQHLAGSKSNMELQLW